MSNQNITNNTQYDTIELMREGHVTISEKQNHINIKQIISFVSYQKSHIEKKIKKENKK